MVTCSSNADTSPVALVPGPGVMRRPRLEVRQAVVVDLGGEAQEAAVGGGVGFGRGAGQTVFLHGTLQGVQRPVLQVGGLLHDRSVENQVWGR